MQARREPRGALRYTSRMAPRALACPRDGAPLVPEPTFNITVDRCPTCRGVWLDGDELQVAIDGATEQAETTPPPPAGRWEAVKYLRCPKCAEHMARANYLRVSGVIVDGCRRCGTWLDRHEIERIGVFLAKGGAARVERAEAGLREEEAEARRDLARRSRQNRAGWGRDAVDLAEALDVLGLLP